MQRTGETLSGLSVASMRPRVFPAEDSAWRRTHSASGDRFNEAAGIPRGRPGTTGTKYGPETILLQ